MDFNYNSNRSISQLSTTVINLLNNSDSRQNSEQISTHHTDSQSKIDLESIQNIHVSLNKISILRINKDKVDGGGVDKEGDSFFRTAIDVDINSPKKKSSSYTPVSPSSPSSPQNATRNTTVITNNEVKESSSSSKDYREKEVKLPMVISQAALRETLFVEAPFVTKNNKAFWRKMLDSKIFYNILAASYTFIVQCIAENGNVILDKLNDIQDSYLIHNIASNVTEMFFTFKRLDRDLFFRSGLASFSLLFCLFYVVLCDKIH